MRTIALDIRGEKGLFSHAWRMCVGAGRAHEMLRDAALTQLWESVRDCGFSYLRFHGLLSDDMGVYSTDRNGNPLYNFQYVDLVFDALPEIGIRPFVELSFTPQAMASGTKTVFWWKANVTPPVDYERWDELIRKLVGHWVLRYGVDEVRQWYFEVWNEPNHPAFYSHDMTEYFRLYSHTVCAIRSVCSDLRVGGPATAGNAWVPELIAFCTENRIPLDFITTHTYGVYGDFDESGEKQLYLSRNENVISDACRRVREQIRGSAMPHLPLFYTERSSSYSSRDPVHDCYIQASYILHHLKKLSPMRMRCPTGLSPIFLKRPESVPPRFTADLAFSISSR